MASTSKLLKGSQVWEKTRVWECLASGAQDKLVWISSGANTSTHYFLSICDSGAKCVQLDDQGNAQIVGRIDVEEDPLCAITSTPDVHSAAQITVFTAHKSGLVRQWIGNKLEEPSTGTVAFKADHKGPILHLRLLHNNAKYNQLITVGSDFLVKLWNIESRHCLSVLRGVTSVPLCAELSQNLKEDGSSTCFLACGLVDGNVKLWRMNREDDRNGWVVPTSAVQANTLQKHNSQVPTVVFTRNTKTTWLVTCGRDQVIAVWDISSNKEPPNCMKLIPNMEEVERVIHVSSKFVQKCITLATQYSEDDHYCITGGQKGKIRLWNISSGREINILQTNQNVLGTVLQNKISDLYLTKKESDFFLVQDDLLTRFQLNATEQGECTKVSFVTTNQYEVLDFAFLENYLIVATTSTTLRLYEFSSSAEGKLLCVSADPNGHTDAILAVSHVVQEATKVHFISCGKDQSVCLWKLVDEKGRKEIKLIAKGVGHSSYVGAVTATTDAIYSASKDGVLKLWGWPQDDNLEDKDAVQSLSSRRNIAAHSAEINCLSSSPDGELVVSGSQDKTVKIWRAADLGLVSTLSGHKRGIWCTKFFCDTSSQQVVLVTTSADCNIKLWNKTVSNTFNCTNTLEGHLSSVLSVTSVPSCKGSGGGTKLATVASDGLLKLWSSENHWNGDVGSFDAHEDKIWAVECVGEDKIITGGRDGQMILWQNVTQSAREQERLKDEELIRTDQRLNNYLMNGKLSKALKLALRTNKPRLAKRTLNTLQKRGELETALHKLSLDERNILFQSLVQWNSFANQSSLVQDILKYLITDSLANKQQISADQCAGLIAYTEKHYQRLDKLQSRLAVVDLLLDTM